MDEGRALQIVPNIIEASSEIKKEKKPMIYESVYPTNGEQKDVSHALEGPDSLLLYQAKLNVKEKKNTTMNVIAYIVSWIVVGLFFDSGVFANRVHPRWWWFSHNFTQLREFAPDSTVDNYWQFGEALHIIELYFLRGYTLPLFYVILGVMLAWGCWIGFRIVKYTAKPLSMKIRAIFIKKAKPDPVIQEYNRLKNMANEETM